MIHIEKFKSNRMLCSICSQGWLMVHDSVKWNYELYYTNSRGYQLSMGMNEWNLYASQSPQNNMKFSLWILKSNTHKKKPLLPLQIKYWKSLRLPLRPKIFNILWKRYRFMTDTAIYSVWYMKMTCKPISFAISHTYIRMNRFISNVWSDWVIWANLIVQIYSICVIHVLNNIAFNSFKMLMVAKNGEMQKERKRKTILSWSRSYTISVNGNKLFCNCYKQR